ncbi:19654_t:CDS:2, partial [Gigaspora rosea]
MPTDMNTEANHTIFNNILRAEYATLILNNPSASHELTQYLSEAVLPMNVDPLSWWELNCTRFPYLSQLARDYLAIQSTSVPSEQVFSKA